MFSLSTNLLITLHHQDLRLLYRYHPVLDHRGRPPALLPNHQWVASWILLKINVLITETLTCNVTNIPNKHSKCDKSNKNTRIPKISILSSNKSSLISSSKSNSDETDSII